MPVGLPEVEGTIDVGRFWPEGRSDADTAKVLVTVAPDAIRFRENDTAPFQPTDVFEGAKVDGRTSAAPIKNGKLTVRLQGIDAPELHYMPSLLSVAEKMGLPDARKQAYREVTHSYRQFLGPTASKALHDFLSSSSSEASLPCRVFTCKRRLSNPHAYGGEEFGHNSHPAETSISCALIQRFSSDSRETIIGPISSGPPGRPSALKLAT
ncbi:hypothetical protein ABIA43_003582 [Bradyrhizobium sp. USDA 328]